MNKNNWILKKYYKKVQEKKKSICNQVQKQNEFEDL